MHLGRFLGDGDGTVASGRQYRSFSRNISPSPEISLCVGAWPAQTRLRYILPNPFEVHSAAREILPNTPISNRHLEPHGCLDRAERACREILTRRRWLGPAPYEYNYAYRPPFALLRPGPLRAVSPRASCRPSVVFTNSVRCSSVHLCCPHVCRVWSTCQLIIAVDDDVLASEAHRHKAGVHRDVRLRRASRMHHCTTRTASNKRPAAAECSATCCCSVILGTRPCLPNPSPT